MSFEAIKVVTDAEEEGKRRIAEASARAKQMAAEAAAERDNDYRKAMEKAEGELSRLSRSMTEEAEETERIFSRESQRERSRLESQAKARMEGAVSVVVERIVKG